MKKDIKVLIKRLTMLVQLKLLGKGWIAIDGGGDTFYYANRPAFSPSGVSESLDDWTGSGGVEWITDLGDVPLSWACPSLKSRDALFYTDGVTVWLVETGV